MPLDNLKNAWKYNRLQSDLAPLQDSEILEIIQLESDHYWSRSQLFYVNVAVLLLLVFVCQSG